MIQPAAAAVSAWRFFDDGKSWLLKVSRGSRTVFWATVERGAFRAVYDRV